tara:strand:- start:341 stop:1054 length:714 start_codon:yes stop_codon:yes gene_type:complete
VIEVESVTPTSMAAKLATYIADPSTIHSHVKSYFGRAPSIDKIRELRAKAEKQNARVSQYYGERYVAHCARHEGPYELEEDGYDRCIQCRKEKADAERAKAEEAAQLSAAIDRAQRRIERDRSYRIALLEKDRGEDLSYVDQVLSRAEKPILFVDTLEAVAAAFDVTPGEILGDSHERIFVDPRTALAMILHLRKSSYPQIGRKMRRDHSSIQNLVKTYDKRIKRNPLIALVVERLA